MRAVHSLTVAVILTLAPAVAGLSGIGDGSSGVTERVPHAPILIDEDADFCRLASGVRNCDTADGTAGNPYRISGWNIRAVGDTNTPAITIKDTTKHVSIEFNGLRAPCADGVPAIVVENAAHVTLLANDLVSGLSSAVVATDVSDFRMQANDVVAACAGLTGVPLVDVSGATGAAFITNHYGGVAGNESALHASDIVTVTDSTGLRFTDNLYENAQGAALTLTRVNVDNATGERILGVRTGLDVSEGGTLEFYDLQADGVMNAISVADTPSFTVTQAALADNFPCSPSCLPIGVVVTNSHFTGEYLRIQDFHHGIIVQDEAGSTTSSEDCQASDEGAWDKCDWTARIRYANITGNDVGVFVEDAAKVYVGESDIHGNSEYGVYSNSSKLVLAHKNWWGHEDGPTGLNKCKGTCGDRVNDKVNVASIQGTPWGW